MDSSSKKEFMGVSNGSGRVRSNRFGSSSNVLRSGSVGTVESDWNLVDKPVVSLYPWDLYLIFRSARLLTVEPVLFLHMLATYLYSYLSQAHFLDQYSRLALQNTSYPFLNETSCVRLSDIDKYTGSNTTFQRCVADRTTDLYVFCTVATVIPSVVATLVLGPLSDRHGRRLPILLAAVGAVLQGLFSLAVVRLELDPRFFILSACLAGVFGSLPATYLGSYAYVLDIGSGKWRTVRIGLVDAVAFLGILIAEQMGAYWLKPKKLGCAFTYPLILFIGCHVIIILYSLVFLPPSVGREERRRKTLYNPTGARGLLRGWGLFCTALGWRLCLVMVAIVIFVINTEGMEYVSSYFFEGLQWGEGKINAFNSVSTASHAAVLLTVLPLLVALRLPDPLLSIVGALAYCLTCVIIGLSTKSAAIFTVAVLQGVGALVFPPLRAYMSKLVYMEDQGALFSVVTSVASLAGLVSILYTYTFPKVIGHRLSPGHAFLVMAALGLVPIPFISVLLIHWCRGRFSRNPSLTEKTPLLSQPRERSVSDHSGNGTIQM